MWASLSFIAVGERAREATSLCAVGSVRSRGAVGALTGYQQVALAVVASIGVAVMVASLAAIVALAARYPRRLNIAAWLSVAPMVSCSSCWRWPDTAGRIGLGRSCWTRSSGTRWIDAPAIVLATVYLSWRAFAERLLTLRSACGVVLVSAAFGAAWVTMLRAAGVQLAGMPTMDAVWMLSPALLPLMASVLAPWSLSRIRHI